MRMILKTRIKTIIQRKTKKHVSGFGPNVVTEEVPSGWSAVIPMSELSNIVLDFGDEPPAFKENADVTIMLEIKE